ncbi:ras family-domain-containing protein [Lactarius pseudohatsudake]|nr:ras family-domain-containing protein [Lactarius pseudohatsudake]
MLSRKGTLLHPVKTHQVKVLLLGAASVGKSSLLLRFTDQQWLPESETQPTVGVDTWTHKLEIKGKHVNLSIWDTSGEERFRTIVSSYYRGTQAIILVYDISDRKSFETIEWWFAERSKHAPKSAVKIIVGNKVDNEHTRQITTADGAAYAARMGALFVESSAKTSAGVREVFRDTLERVLESPIPFKLEPIQMSVSSTVSSRATQHSEEW